jgi:hypothetical protein
MTYPNPNPNLDPNSSTNYDFTLITHPSPNPNPNPKPNPKPPTLTLILTLVMDGHTRTVTSLKCSIDNMTLISGTIKLKIMVSVRFRVRLQGQI